jgi:hypothetical protein
MSRFLETIPEAEVSYIRNVSTRLDVLQQIVAPTLTDALHQMTDDDYKKAHSEIAALLLKKEHFWDKYRIKHKGLYDVKESFSVDFFTRELSVG